MGHCCYSGLCWDNFCGPVGLTSFSCKGLTTTGQQFAAWGVPQAQIVGGIWRQPRNLWGDYF